MKRKQDVIISMRTEMRQKFMEADEINISEFSRQYQVDWKTAYKHYKEIINNIEYSRKKSISQQEIILNGLREEIKKHIDGGLAINATYRLLVKNGSLDKCSLSKFKNFCRINFSGNTVTE